MNITFLIIIAALAIIAAGATAIALLRERAPRIVADPERVARLRDRLACGFPRPWPGAPIARLAPGRVNLLPHAVPRWDCAQLGGKG